MSSSPEQRRGGRRKRKGKISLDTNNSASASLIGSNVDMLTLILTRLPSKSLLVFKCVSKQWYFMINDPKFVHKHFIQNPTLSIPGLFWANLSLEGKPTYNFISLDGNTNNYVPFRTLDFGEDKFGARIVQSCNGLFLCRSCSRESCNFTYYIFNPFTKQYKILPQSQMKSVHSFVSSISLAFHPSESPYYKVIAFWKNRKSSCYEYRIEMYDSETSSWRWSGFYSCTPQPLSIPMRQSGIYYNRSLHWCHQEGSMVYFEIDRKLVGVNPMPHQAQEYDGNKTFNIAEYGGRFYRIERNNAFGLCFRIFEMNPANSSWIVKGQVDLSLNPYGGSPSGSAFPPFSNNILFITGRGEEEESAKVVLLTEQSMVVSYDLKDMSFEKIYDLSARQQFPFGTIKFYQYIESLAFV